MWKSILHNVKYKQRIASVDIQLIIKNNINNIEEIINNITTTKNPIVPSSSPSYHFGLQLAGFDNYNALTNQNNKLQDDKDNNIEDIFSKFGPLLFAVPKSKISKSKKRIKNAMKRNLKPMKHIINCRNCGAPKERHRLCMFCENPKPRRKVSKRTGYNWGWPHYADEDFEDITDDKPTEIPDNFLDDVVAVDDAELKKKK